MSSSGQPRIAVLLGGPSAEREVSLVSGRLCAAALRDEGFEVTEIDAGESLVDDLRAANPDVVFNALHGRWGEDGCVQGLLEWMRIPYTHSGVLASSLAMDKLRTKAAYRTAGLPVVPDLRATKAEVSAAHPMEPPYVVKPYNEGSSVGIYIVQERANGPAQVSDDMPDALMVEEYVPGRELTVSVLDRGAGPRALYVTDIVSNTGWYDYEAKYGDGGSSHVVPADLPEEITALCLDYAERAHAVLGCRGLSRTDLRWDETRGRDGLFLLETNTQPGMTPTSLTPEQAEHAGISFGALCRLLVEDASCDR
ncbi:D-alanine--D-alanine ligase [Pontivivens insulae]|uniref:D-alanine--D-alanine ligase n=1 Tax=Pontivivens insulae TaxID=1639689 RepID=A0A2R8ADR0_9RHOB|nr:D-alanine--D-alanine ligase [Pontivivens insulae]RED14217.1 D-alanine--D-alanine ligase [Pontivivens insulae]SPF30292.1 D-alanine--D-alanine ligase B [Pontivivens insulae]